MNTYVIDTNALISFLTDRNPQQQAGVSEIFQEAASLKARILCPQNVLTEFIFVMDRVYEIPKSKIRELLHDFMAMPGVTVIHELDFPNVLSYWPESIPDFGDAVVASVCRSNQPSIIVTFDQKLTKKLNLLGFEVAL